MSYSTRRAPSWVVAVILIVLGAGLGLLGGIVVYWLQGNGVLTRWIDLGTPPGGAAQILDATSGRGNGLVWVRTRDGRVFACDTSSGGACWEERVREVHRAPSPCIPPPNLRVSAPPGPVVDQKEVQDCPGNEGTGQFDWVVLQDGRVWLWRYTEGGLVTVLRLLLTVGAGVLLGAVLGAGLWGILWLRARRS